MLLDRQQNSSIPDPDATIGAVPPPVPEIVRSPSGWGSTITLTNGRVVELTGIGGSLYYPPNYLDDLRAGRW